MLATAERPTPNQAKGIIDALAADPVLFATDILGHDPWEVPRQIMRAIARPRARVAVKACHSSAKTYTAAEIVLWWTCTGGVSVTTAPTDTQVKRLLWGEIGKAHAGSRFPLGGRLMQKELHISPDVYALGLSTNEGVRFQGWHGRVLLVLDEAPGVRPDIYEAIEGIRAGGDVRVLLLGNPTIASGPFYDAFTSNRASWMTFTIDAFDTPNLDGLTVEDLRALPDDQLDVNPRPYLTTRRWVREKLDEWGEGHPLWEARVRGRFPAQAEDALLSLTWLEQARYRPAIDDGSPVTAGLDVAGPGEDETVLTIRQGPRILAMQSWAAADPRGEVVAALMPYQPRLEVVNVDSIGIGWGMAVHLADTFPVRAVNVGMAPVDIEKYKNLKAELYWGLRMRARAGDLAGLVDEKAIAQLASIRYVHNARGQVVIESKEDARKRGVKSPDRGESVMLAFAALPPVHDEGVVVYDDPVRISSY